VKYLTIQSRTGRFNLCDPSEESVSTNITLWEYGNPEPIKRVNIKTEYEMEHTDFDFEDIALEVINLLEAEDKRYFISTNRQNVADMKKLIEECSDDIPQGQKQFLLDSLIKKREGVQEQLERLNKRIVELQADLALKTKQPNGEGEH